jgi:hypothetical protein
LDLQGGARVKRAGNVLDFTIAPDESAVALLEPGGIEVLSEQSTVRYAFLAIPDPKQITSLAWYKDMNHLFLGYRNRIVFLDLGDTTLQNLTTLAASDDFVYLARANELYALSQGTLMRFRFP